MVKPLPCALTIAGSDSSGGAGIQADLKTFAMQGVYGASVITALTAQNTTGVADIHAPPARFVAEQMRSVLSDLDVRAAKTGMLFSGAIIKAVAPFLKKKDFPLVVDPVCVAQSGGKLLEDSAVEAMAERIFPLADLLTPNAPETEFFTGVAVKTPADVHKAAAKLLKMGPKAVLIKGGHLGDSVAATDWYCAKGDKPLPFMQQRVKTRNLHGTGCTLSSAIAAWLARGLDMPRAVRRAQAYLNLCLRTGYDIGRGSGPPNHLAPMLKEQGRAAVLEELDMLVRSLAGLPGLARLVPGHGLGLALAMEWVEGDGDIASFTVPLMATLDGDVVRAGCPGFGVQPRLARALLAARKVRPDVTCLATLRQDETVIAALKKAKLAATWFDRANEPGASRAGAAPRNNEAATLEWGLCHALNATTQPGRIGAVLDRGNQGVEPLVFLLGRTAKELVERVSTVLGALGKA